MKHTIRKLATTAALAASVSFSAQADTEFLTDWLNDLDADLFVRYRLALIEDDNFDRGAVSSTIQTLVGVKTSDDYKLQAYVQFRNVSNVFSNNVNDTVNGRTQFPVEADPVATEIDQAYLTYKGLPIPKTTVSVGRKKLDWGNLRFVAKLVWRQNHRSFDGVFVDSEPTKNTKIRYAYAFNVNRAFTDRSAVGNFEGNFNLVNVEQKIGDIGTLTAYGYWINQDDAFALATSTQTIGANFTGSRDVGGGKLKYIGEYANQINIGTNPLDINENYMRGELGYAHSGWSFRGGYELLGGGGVRGFQTPFALLHAYNGFADRFLVTPPDGLRDMYAQVGYNFPKDSFMKGAKAFVRFHDFNSDNGNYAYGTEWNAQIVFPLFGPVKGLLKYAQYDSLGFSADVSKFWFQLAAKF